MLDQNTFEKAMNDACAELYRTKKHFIDERAHERTIVSDFVAPFLRHEFQGWDVNTEYNREGVDRGPKKDLKGKLLIPDIVIHKHGPKGPNVVAVQVKGYWNNADRTIDENLLRKLQAKHGYELLYRLELGKEKHELIKIV